MNLFFAALIVLLPIAASVYGYFRIYKALKAPASDYSFGSDDLQAISRLLRKGAYTDAGNRLNQLNADDLTQAVDHIAVACPEKTLNRHMLHSANPGTASLLRGAQDLYKAWRIRGHDAAAQLSPGKFELYTFLLKSAAGILETAAKEGKLAAEAHSRLIRTYMSLGYDEQARGHFKMAVQKDSNHLWSYIHYAELIQPKWYGSVEEVKQFLNELPARKLISTIIRLKLLYDGLLSRENYFGLTEDNTHSFIASETASADTLMETEKQTIHRFVAYGYIYLLASYTGNKSLEKKYRKLLGTNLPLYPFGIPK